jgi:hypothetical protein
MNLDDDIFLDGSLEASIQDNQAVEFKIQDNSSPPPEREGSYPN